MSGFFKNKRKLSVLLGALLLVVTLATGTAAYFLDGLSPGPRSPLGLPAENSVSEPSSSAQEEEAPPAQQHEQLPDGQPPETAEYNMPVEMRGVYLSPGVDYLKTQDTSAELMRGDIDRALENAKALTMNTVIVDTRYNDKVIFKTKDAPVLSAEWDIMDYIVKQAREQGLHVCAIFDVSLFRERAAVGTMAIGAGYINRLSANLRQFVEAYELDAVLLDGYTNQAAEQSYPAYLQLGGAIGFDNFMRQTPAAAVKTAARTVRTYAPATQVGLLADAVWENKSANEQGSATEATFTALGSGNADTKGFVEEGLVDFVAVEAFASLTDKAEPFGEVVKWWAQVARTHDLPLYVVHASAKVCTDESGWQAQDQLARQVIEAASVSGFKGSIFNNLARLVADPQQATTTLVKYYKQETAPEHILTELAVTKPEKTTYTTYEPNVIFTGASDPNAPVTINGTEIPTDESGYFTVNYELAAGENRFTITHKAKTIQYVITRQVQVLKEASPMGSVTTEGSMSLTITALAYADAEVTASINGTTVILSRDDSPDKEEDRDSAFRTFSGEYTVPAATGEVQNLGNIVVTATWQGQTESITAASVKVNKRARVEDGVPVVVIADQARTYPPDTLNNIPNASYYPLPKGAKDYAVGDEIVYKKNGETYTYFVLASGLRVETKDIQPTSDDDYVSGNVVSGLSVSSEGGFTFITLKTAQQVTYTFRYTNNAVEIKLHNTVQTPADMQLSKNPLFTQATWSDNTLTLTLAQQAAFMGYRGYYDSEGNLVFKFNNPPASLSAARIVIDPGHGGRDVGATGFLADYSEKVINSAIASYVADELTSRGATVKLLDTSGGMELEERVRQAEQFNADLFVSIHNNTAPRADAAGTETYYFYPYGWRLANSLAKQVSGQLGTTNRGPKASYYHVTLSAQVPSVLLECGFMSNKDEYEKLIKKSYQQKIAVGVADAISSAIKATYTGSDSTGSESTGSAPSLADDDTTASGADAPVLGDLPLSHETLSLAVGETATLDAYTADDTSVTWSSGNTSVATVNSRGAVTARREGTVKITATAKDGSSAVCTVTVGPEESRSSQSSAAGATDGVALGSQEDIYVYNDGAVIYPGKTQQLFIRNMQDQTIRPGDFTWESSDPSIARVNDIGVVTGVKVGTAEILATARANPEVSVLAYVEVSRKSVEVSSISLDSTMLSVVKGKTARLTATLSPSNASLSDVRWSSENERIAKVDQNGVVTGVNAGTTTIRVRAKSGNASETCEVTVVRTEIVPDYIELDEMLELYVGDEDQLYAGVYPEDATNKAVVWRSNNSSVVSVDSNGNIRALKPGKATITVTASGARNVRATCEITVLE